MYYTNTGLFSSSVTSVQRDKPCTKLQCHWLIGCLQLRYGSMGPLLFLRSMSDRHTVMLLHALEVQCSTYNTLDTCIHKHLVMTSTSLEGCLLLCEGCSWCPKCWCCYGATLVVELTQAFCCLRASLGQPHVPRFASHLLISGIFIILLSCELWCEFKTRPATF